MHDNDMWELYLSHLTSPVADSVRSVWSKLSSHSGITLRPPVAGPGGEADFQLSWRTDKYYLDIDIGHSGRFGWYFWDRTTNTDAGSVDNNLIDSPEELIQNLKRVSEDDMAALARAEKEIEDSREFRKQFEKKYDL